MDEFFQFDLFSIFDVFLIHYIIQCLYLRIYFTMSRKQTKLQRLIESDNKCNGIYLDYNAFVPVMDPVIDIMPQILRKSANASSAHKHGQQANQLLEASRESIKELLNCRKDDVLFFTSCATESNNSALYGFKHIVDSYIIGSTDHESVYTLLDNISDNYKKSTVLVRDGVVDLVMLEEFLKQSKKALVSIMLVNNETGLVTSNLKKAITLVHKYDGIFHSDATQATIKWPIDFTDLDLDLMTISSLKTGAIVGSGGCIVKGPISKIMTKLIHGGNKEMGMRAGSPSVSLIAVFARSVEIALDDFEQESAKLRKWRDDMEADLKTHGAIVFGDNPNCTRVANTSYIAMPYLDHTEQVMQFDMHNIALSTGAACYSNRVYSEIFLNSQDLSAYNITELSDLEKAYRASIRVSMGFNTTEKDMITFREVWKNIKHNI